MSDKKSFLRSLCTLLMIKDIEINKDKNEVFYELMKKDFVDAEFEKICEIITKKENLYGKYPDPAVFYEYKQMMQPKRYIMQ